MPRSGDGTWSDIPNITAVPGEVIESADWNNYRADLRNNEFNAARPITAGGTGATNASDALDNLGGVGQSNFLAAFAIGDGFYSARDISAAQGTWLRRDGTLYNTSEYPALAALLPSLPDDIEWSSKTSSATSIRAAVARSSGFTLLSASGSDTLVYFSSDGESWGTVATIPSFSAQGLAFGGGVYVAVDGSGKVSTSNDGVTWSSPVTPTATGFGGIAYGNSLFVAVGTGGGIETSPDGSTWTSRTSGVATQLNDVAYYNSTFIAVGSSGVILTSTNGTTWTPRTSGVSVALQGAAYGAGVYVVVGDPSGGNGVILSSTNLTAWTPRASGTTSALNAVTCSTSGFLAVGSNGVARFSSNGTSWSASGTGVSSTLVSAIFDPDSQSEYYALGGPSILKGLRTLTTQFRVPNDSPTYGWIKAENAT